MDDGLLRQVGEVVRAALPADDQSIRVIAEGLLERGILRGSNRYGKFDYLPQEVIDNLARIRDEAAEAGPGTFAAQQLNYYLYQLHAAGWTLESLGNALRVTRERVRQRIAKAAIVPLDAPVVGPPAPPENLPIAPPPADPVQARCKIPEDDVSELLRLHKLAVRYRGQMPATSAPAVAGRELAALMNRLITEEGSTAYAVAKAMGVTPNAVNFRLGRHGYRDLPPSRRRESQSAGRPAA